MPIYGAAAMWAIWCLFLPLYRLSHFLYAAAASAAVYVVMLKLFPTKTETVKEPEKPVETGNAEIDALLREGERAVKEMQRLKKSIGNEAIGAKIDTISGLTDRIFKDLIDDPEDIKQVKRFASYYLPTTIKLLNAYDRMAEQGVEGENITGTKKRIEDILDKTAEAYKKQLDALFYNQALDIDTDITVLEGMLRREGLAGNDFNIRKD